MKMKERKSNTERYKNKKQTNKKTDRHIAQNFTYVNKTDE